MYDTVILLTGLDEQPVFASILRGYNPQLIVAPVGTSEDLAAVPAEVLSNARLIAFATEVIVPQNVLDQLGYGAYNFHPGPPQFPGWAPAHFALYQQAKEFGATLHVMVKRVDAGPIVDVVRFAVPPDISAAGLEELAYAQLVQMFRRSAPSLATRVEPLPQLPIAWSGKKSSRRAYQAICNIPVTIAKDELRRRIKVFGDGHHGIAPTINLHGIQFRAVPPEQGQA